jgi:aminobenzoyl-glutamate utilization protein B
MTQLLRATLALTLPLLAQTPPVDRAKVLAGVDARAARYGDISRKIWDAPELQFQETRSAALLRDELAANGFRIQDNVAGLRTAFIAEWGQGKPVIAILGEYDALPGLSQESIPERKPVVAGAPGHGCGHNLFGAASALAAVTVKDYLASHKLPGTIRFYGTPAEEGGGGKIYMIRAGAFKDVDAALVWHPADRNQADNQGWLANVSAKVRFYGKAAHAAASPDLGRSALDAVEVMNYAVNLMREHVPQETRIHYVITNGGAAANIVPDFAEVSLIARHPDLKTLEGIWERLMNCAQAGALATGTRMEVEITAAYANQLPNDALVALLDRSLRSAGGVTYTEEERAFAEKVRASVGATLPLAAAANIDPPRTTLLSASTDVGDVSWVLPTGQFLAATFPPGIPFHSWQSTACAGSSIGRKGMVVAAKTLALAAIDLFSDPALVAAAKASFDQGKTNREYRSLLPAGAKPQPR